MYKKNTDLPCTFTCNNKLNIVYKSLHLNFLFSQMCITYHTAYYMEFKKQLFSQNITVNKVLIHQMLFLILKIKST